MNCFRVTYLIRHVEDVYAVKAWLGVFIQAGYDFPLLKQRHRNVAVMGLCDLLD